MMQMGLSTHCNQGDCLARPHLRVIRTALGDDGIQEQMLPVTVCSCACELCDDIAVRAGVRPKATFSSPLALTTPWGERVAHVAAPEEYWNYDDTTKELPDDDEEA